MNNALATFLAGWLKRRQDLALKRKQRAIAVSTVLLLVGCHGQHKHLFGHLFADWGTGWWLPSLLTAVF